MPRVTQIQLASWYSKLGRLAPAALPPGAHEIVDSSCLFPRNFTKEISFIFLFYFINAF